MLLALGGAALVSLRPWATTALSPQLSVSPGLGVALGDSVVVARSHGAGSVPVPAVAVGRATPAIQPAVEHERGSVAEVAVAQARPLGRPVAAAPPKPSPPPTKPPSPPQTPQASPPPAAPTSVPVAAPVPQPEAATMPTRVPAGFGPGSPGPVGAGLGDEEGAAEPLSVCEGGEYALSFLFQAQPTAYTLPGFDNSIVRFVGKLGAVPSFGLQLWDGSAGEHGLWSSGEAMGGERFLAPLADGAEHELVVYLRASSEGDGFYLASIDDQPVDLRAGVSLIEAGSDCARVEVGLRRIDEPGHGSPEVRLEDLELTPLGSVLP